MEQFVYKPGETTVDDVIEQFLIKFNSKNPSIKSSGIQSICGNQATVVKEVSDKLVKEGLARRTISLDPKLKGHIEITGKGIEMFNNGGWKKHLRKIEQEKKEKEERIKEQRERAEIEKNEGRDLSRRSVEAAERSAKSAEKSATFSQSSARGTWIAAIAAVGALALSLYTFFKPEIKEVDFKELQKVVQVQQGEVRELKGRLGELDSLRTVVRIMSEVKQNARPGKQR